MPTAIVLRRACPVLLAATLLVGCKTAGWNTKKAINAVDDGWARVTGKPDDCDDPWDQFDPHEPGGPEWWAEQAQLPIGQRQKIHKGKVWPPHPRPVGPNAQWSHRYHAAKYWPYPYVCQDRAVVNMYIDAHTRNGWEEATTLWDYHFEPETNALSDAGRRQLEWILVHVPESRRHVFVQKSFDAVRNEARLEVVRSELDVLTCGEEMCNVPVALRLDTPVGRPAEEVDAIRRAELSVVPVPHILPDNAQTATGNNSNPAPTPGGP